MYNEYDFITSNTLKHRGVKGMKWGVRRERSDRRYRQSSKRRELAQNQLDRAVDKRLSTSRKQKVSNINGRTMTKMDSFFRAVGIYTVIATGVHFAGVHYINKVLNG